MDKKKLRLILNVSVSLILAIFTYVSISTLSKNAFSYGLTSIFRQSIFLFYLVLGLISLIFLFKNFYWAKITSIVSISWYGIMYISTLMIELLAGRPLVKSFLVYTILAIIGIVFVSISIKNQNTQ